MPDEPLTYRASGVDVDVNNEANERIKRHVRRARTARVVTEPGLFSGGVSLKDFQGKERPALAGSLGRGKQAAGVLEDCRRRLPRGAEPVAFLDYLASSRLDAAGVEGWVGAFADCLEGSGIPLVGGETAEMPGVFRPGAWEAVGALYGVVAGRPEAGTPTCRESEAAPCRAGALLSGAAGGRERPEGSGLPLAGLDGRGDPILMLSMDGVGTKAKLGAALRQTRGLAFDMVGHSVNDILCQGARGLGMAVYLGCHARDGELVDRFREGMEDALQMEGLGLLDFTVVEDPQAYLPGELDICASIAGLVDRERMITGAGIRPGDLAVGLASDGLHTNGYSLARQALLERGGLSLSGPIAELGATLGQALLTPHRGYARSVLPLLAGAMGRPQVPARGEARVPGAGRCPHPCRGLRLRVRAMEGIAAGGRAGAGGAGAGGGSPVRGIAHITGGGLQDNVARILPDGLGMEIRTSAWPVPPLFSLIQRVGRVPAQDPSGKGMYETFNMGIGLVLVVDPARAGSVTRALQAAGERVWTIGRVVERPRATAARERVRLAP